MVDIMASKETQRRRAKEGQGWWTTLGQATGGRKRSQAVARRAQQIGTRGHPKKVRVAPVFYKKKRGLMEIKSDEEGQDLDD